MKNLKNAKYPNIEIERLKAGLSTEELCQMAGISTYRYPKIIDGSSRLDIETLKRLCEIFSCDQEYLIQENKSNYGKSRKEATVNG